MSDNTPVNDNNVILTSDNIQDLVNTTMIEIPGQIPQVDYIIECLGGVEKVRDAMSRNTPESIALTFDPDDPLSSCVFSKKKPCFGLVIHRSVINGETIYSCVTICTQIHTFLHMADYHNSINYIYRYPVDIFGEICRKASKQAMCNLKTLDMIPPSNYSRQLKPYKKQTVSNYFAMKKNKSDIDEADLIADLEHLFVPENRDNININTFHDLLLNDPNNESVTMNLTCSNTCQNVYTECSEAVKNIKLLKHEQESHDKIKQAFDDKPIWLRNSLLEYVS